MVKTLILKTATTIGAIALILFTAAGTLHWPGAWVFLGTWLLLGLCAGLWFAFYNPDLLAERLKPMVQDGQPRADKIFIMVLGFVAVIWFVVIAFDAQRFHISHVPLGMQIIGFAAIVLAIAGAFMVLLENSFAAPVIKVQSERGHRVITTGPYAYVRHPMYAAVIPFVFGVPLLLGSWCGLAFAPVFVAAFAVRAVIEERTLLLLLEGYREYTTRVRYRLIPGVW